MRGPPGHVDLPDGHRFIFFIIIHAFPVTFIILMAERCLFVIQRRRQIVGHFLPSKDAITRDIPVLLLYGGIFYESPLTMRGQAAKEPEKGRTFLSGLRLQRN